MAYEPEDTPEQRSAREAGFRAGQEWATERAGDDEVAALLELRGTPWTSLPAEPTSPSLHKEFVRLGARARAATICWPREPFSEGFLGGVLAVARGHGARAVA